jgi:hypothetical protein
VGHRHRRRQVCPQKVKDLRRFLGTCNWYSQFVDDYSDTIAPLTDRLKYGAKWRWTEVDRISDGTVRKFRQPRNSSTVAEILSTRQITSESLSEFVLSKQKLARRNGGMLFVNSSHGHIATFASYDLTPSLCIHRKQRDLVILLF